MPHQGPWLGASQWPQLLILGADGRKDWSRLLTDGSKYRRVDTFIVQRFVGKNCLLQFLLRAGHFTRGSSQTLLSLWQLHVVVAEEESAANRFQRLSYRAEQTAFADDSHAQ